MIDKWFNGLTKRERKDLVCLLFDIRNRTDLSKFVNRKLFEELMSIIDDYYHELKHS